MVEISFRSQDLNEVSPGLYTIRMQLTSGYSEPVSVRGTDIVVPSLAGRVRRNRKADVRSLHLEGYVSGVDRFGWREGVDLLMAVLDTRLDPGDLVLTGPYLGIDMGFAATISARTLNVMSGPIIALMHQRFDADLESIDPDWVTEAVGS